MNHRAFADILLLAAVNTFLWLLQVWKVRQEHRKTSVGVLVGMGPPLLPPPPGVRSMVRVEHGMMR